jgi:apolipoprotein N-acyltransferase
MKLFLYALGLGAASAFAFEPFGWWPLLPVAFAVLCELICRAKSLRLGLAIGWGFGFGQFAVGLNWIATAFTFQSNMPAWLGWVAVLLLSLYLAIYPALASGLAWRFGRDNRVAMALVLGGAWAITEWLRGAMFTGFPWNPAAAVLAPTPLISLAPLIGTYGLSAFVVLLGGTVWLEYHRKWLPLVLIIAVALVAWLIPSASVPSDPLTIRTVRIVQPNIGQQDKWSPGFEAEAQKRLATLTGPPSEEPRLVFWPEAAITRPVVDSRPGGDASAAQQRLATAPLLGAQDRLLTGGIALGDATATNSVFVIGPGGQLVGRYDKAHLVPYGEYLPMRPLLSAIGLSRLAPGEADFASGPGPQTIDLGLPWGKVGFQLCYEIIFSGQVVDRAHRPTFIFNPSNDAWFGRWGPPQHLAQARLRAAEEGLPIIRATPTGISAVIDARGKVVSKLEWRKAGVIDAVLPPDARSRPPFARLGNLLPLVLSFLLLAGGIVLGRRRG